MESVHGTALRAVAAPRRRSRRARTRYRAKRALRGAAITVAASWALVALGGVLMNAFHYADGVVLGVRIVAIARSSADRVGSSCGRSCPSSTTNRSRSTSRSMSDSLKASRDHRRRDAEQRARRERRDALAGADRPTDAHRARARAQGRRRTAIDAGELKMNGGILAAVLGAAMLLTMFGPPVLRHGLKLIAVPWTRRTPRRRCSASPSIRGTPRSRRAATS